MLLEPPPDWQPCHLALRLRSESHWWLQEGAPPLCRFLQDPWATEPWPAAMPVPRSTQALDAVFGHGVLGGCRRRQRCCAGPCTSPCAA